MAQFRLKKLDLGCHVNVRTLRDHTKRRIFERYEPERYVHTDILPLSTPQAYYPLRPSFSSSQSIPTTPRS